MALLNRKKLKLKEMVYCRSTDTTKCPLAMQYRIVPTKRSKEGTTESSYTIGRRLSPSLAHSPSRPVSAASRPATAESIIVCRSRRPKRTRRRIVASCTTRSLSAATGFQSAARTTNIQLIFRLLQVIHLSHLL